MSDATCPTDDVLVELLRNSNESDATIEKHIERCTSCQSRLDCLEESEEIHHWRDLLKDTTSHGETNPLSIPNSDSWTRETLPNISGYEVHREIGRGGMGVIYKATQTTLNRPVAIKMLIAGALAGPERMQRFRIEAESIARLKHSHIVAIHHVGEWDGVPFLELEFIEGPNLAEFCAGEPVPVSWAAHLVELLAQAVDVAHRQGIIHRDIKPANILLEGVSSESSLDSLKTGIDEIHPKLTDFGLARQIDQQSLTHSQQAMGTPSYMAPEQIEGGKQAVSLAVDVYSLGAVFYELLTGRPPFRGVNTADTLRQTMEFDLTRPKSLVKSVPRELESICLKCLEPDPRRRYSSALDLADDLKRWRNHEPILARPPRFWVRAGKWIRRHKAATVVLAILFVAVATTLGIWIDLTAKLHTQTQVATEKARQATTNAERADANFRQAQASAAGMEEVIKFLTKDLMNAPKPAVKGRDVKVVELLSVSDKEIDQRFQDRPAVAAAIRLTLAQALLELAEFDDAKRHLLLARDYYQDTLGPDALEVTQCRIALAELYHETGEIASSIALYDELLEQTDRVLPEEILSLRLSRTNALLYAREFALLAKELPSLEQDCERLLGRDHETTVGCYENRGIFTFMQGNKKQAKTLLEKSLEGHLAVYGPEHPATIKSRNSLAVVFQTTGNTQDAISMHKENLKATRKLYGETHPETVSILENMAMAYSRSKQYEKAHPLLAEALQLRVDAVGATHEASLGTIQNLAYMHFEFGHPERAAKILETWIDPLFDHPHDHVDWGVMFLTYGRVRMRLREFAEAQKHFERASQIFKDCPGATPLMTRTLENSRRQLKKLMANPS